MDIPRPIEELVLSLVGMKNKFMEITSVDVDGDLYLVTGVTSPGLKIFHNIAYVTEYSLLCIGYSCRTEYPTALHKICTRELEAYSKDGFSFLIIPDDPCTLLATRDLELDERFRFECTNNPQEELLEIMTRLPAVWSQAADFLEKKFAALPPKERRVLH